MARVHVLIRLLLLMALGAVGWSSIYWAAYLALPAVAALLVAQRGGDHYLTGDAPRIVRGLQWLAGAYAYLWLLTDAFPDVDGKETVRLEIRTTGQPTASSALIRLLSNLPAMIVLTVFSIVAGFLWVVGAIWILFVRRTPKFVFDFLCTTLRYQFRLIGYHLSLVDAYPSFEEAHLGEVSTSGSA
jgi:hypothetical protein